MTSLKVGTPKRALYLGLKVVLVLVLTSNVILWL